MRKSAPVVASQCGENVERAPELESGTSTVVDQLSLLGPSVALYR